RRRPCRPRDGRTPLRGARDRGPDGPTRRPGPRERPRRTPARRRPPGALPGRPAPAGAWSTAAETARRTSDRRDPAPRPGPLATFPEDNRSWPRLRETLGTGRGPPTRRAAAPDASSPSRSPVSARREEDWEGLPTPEPSV